MTGTVVIIEDSIFICELLADFFRDQLKFQVLATGNNGMQAVSLYKKHKPDLITLDLTMPVKDGKTALKEILAEFPAARVLVISSQIGPPMLECMQIGAAGYVEKPLRFEETEFVDEFKDSIESALAKKA